MERLRSLAEVSLIFFYAPWCAHSMAARQEVQQVARKLAKQVQNNTSPPQDASMAPNGNQPSESQRGKTASLSLSLSQVQFLAVNCWWSHGKCRKQNRFYQYPVIHLFYRR